jgi:hypothetical protein
MARKRERPLRRIPISKYPFTPDTYPGRRPRFSFFFTPQGICPVRLGTLGKLLQSRDLPPLDERYAILAYGSNACPAQLRQKCEEYGLNDVPVLYGRLTGAETVYARRTTKRGYVPATLAKAKTSRSSWITLLTAGQLWAMDRSESRPNSYYVLAEISGIRFSIGRSRIAPLYAYVNIFRGVMIRNAKPVCLHSTSQKRARSLLASTTGEDAANWLDFVTIPNPNPPAQYSKILKR